MTPSQGDDTGYHTYWSARDKGQLQRLAWIRQQCRHTQTPGTSELAKTCSATLIGLLRNRNWKHEDWLSATSALSVQSDDAFRSCKETDASCLTTFSWPARPVLLCPVQPTDSSPSHSRPVQPTDQSFLRLTPFLTIINRITLSYFDFLLLHWPCLYLYVPKTWVHLMYFSSDFVGPVAVLNFLLVWAVCVIHGLRFPGALFICSHVKQISANSY